ncbi:methyltransferase domain-containing protein [Micromonospora musae]
MQEFVEELPAGPVLDVGCGSGRDGMFARTLGRDVIFADAAFEMLRHVPRDMAVCCDVLSLPFRDELFAGVIVSGVLLHVPRESCPATLAELLRITAEGGQVSLSMKSGPGEGWRRTGEVPGLRWFTYYTEEEFAALCAEAGFAVLRAWKSPREDWFTVVVTRSHDE